MTTDSIIVLREKRITDAWNDYTWETDTELSYLDAASPVNITFSQYLSEYANQLRNCPPTSRRLAIETLDSKHIGNCSYYDISGTKGEAELGILIGDRDYWDRGYGTAAVITLIDHIFCRTNISRIYLKTLESNSRAQRCFQKCGFTPYNHMERDGFSFMLMDISWTQWREQPNKAQVELSS